MANNQMTALELNGYKESLCVQEDSVQPSQTAESGIKIVVVGEAKCGKSTFIETFYNKHKLKDVWSGDKSKVYECQYIMSGRYHIVKLVELVSGPDEILYWVIKKHADANGFILMFAVDDLLSFDKVTEKWYKILNREAEGLWKNKEPAIVVGNKRDLREDRRTIRWLERDNKVPVTEEQGRGLVQGKIRDYFDCSSTQLHNVHDVFERMLAWALDDFNNKTIGRAQMLT